MQSVLIADDNPQNLYFLEVLLKGNGFEARLATNGAEALDSARNNPPDLIVTDILMPVMDGYTLCREWRADERLCHIPFIFYTATYTDRKDEILALSLGGDRFLVKPLEPEVLINVIRELLSTSGADAVNLPRASISNEFELLREYNEALARKLEKKMNDLKQANRELAELNDFTSAVSHDLRTPMRQLRSYSQILMENLAGRLDAENALILQKIVEKSAAAMEMVDTLLELSRLGNTDVVREEVDLSGLVLGILNELSAAEPDRGHLFDVAAGLRLQADRRLMRILLMNLLENAWKFSANRPVTRITVSATPGDDGSVFCIADNGAGFDVQYADALFIPFQRLHGQEEFPGVGIGLATVNNIVRRHGGRIWAESEPDKGASFYFTLGETDKR